MHTQRVGINQTTFANFYRESIVELLNQAETDATLKRDLQTHGLVYLLPRIYKISLKSREIISLLKHIEAHGPTMPPCGHCGSSMEPLDAQGLCWHCRL